MANSNKPFGLRPYSSLNGGPWSGNVRKFYVPATDANAIYIGDLVKITGDEGSKYADDYPMPQVEIAASTDVVVGVVVGVEPLYGGDLGVLYRKASTEMYVYVDTDPNTIFMIQGDSDTWTTGDVGLNCNVTVTAGSTVTGVSKTVLKQGDAATTATLDVQILATVPQPDNDLTGGYPLVLVRLNNHQYVDGTTGVA